jgi:hypothetical protein
MYVCAGRRANMELQLPLVRRILDDNPDVEYHVWNFSRLESDREYVKTIAGMGLPRTTVFNEVGPMGHNHAYGIYTQPEYKDTIFVKVDDDIVFIETGRFGKFLQAIVAHPGAVISANIVNNGACTPLEPGIWAGFNELGMHLLDVHTTSVFADMAHTYFFDHFDQMIRQPVTLIPSEDWLSVNMIGYNWDVARHLVDTIGTPHPAVLAGRPLKRWQTPLPGAPYGIFGCEGAWNTLPKIIMKGFTAAHMSFGPQKATEEQLERWGKNYRQLGEQYLNSPPKYYYEDGLPGLSPVSRGQNVVVELTKQQWQQLSDTLSGWAGRDDTTARVSLEGQNYTASQMATAVIDPDSQGDLLLKDWFKKMVSCHGYQKGISDFEDA